LFGKIFVYLFFLEESEKVTKDKKSLIVKTKKIWLLNTKQFVEPCEAVPKNETQVRQ